MLPWTPPAGLGVPGSQAVPGSNQSYGQLGNEGPQNADPSSNPMMHMSGNQMANASLPPQPAPQMSGPNQGTNGLPLQPNSGANLPPGQQMQPGPPPPVPPPPLTLSQVLHFLQTEYRRQERERNEWEIERGEMRARIALLEGERRGHENVRQDLIRRVKMLEFALRGERSKHLALPKEGKESATSGKGGQAKSEERPSSPSGSTSRSDPVEVEPVAFPTSTAAPTLSTPAPPLPSHLPITRPPSVASLAPVNGSAAGADRSTPGEKLNAAGAASLTSVGATLPGSWNPAIGRDPRGRARSRDYLKQCLQEINYLTSSSTLNPLPERTANGFLRPARKVVPLTSAGPFTTAPSSIPPAAAPLPAMTPFMTPPPPAAPPSTQSEAESALSPTSPTVESNSPPIVFVDPPPKDDGKDKASEPSSEAESTPASVSAGMAKSIPNGVAHDAIPNGSNSPPRSSALDGSALHVQTTDVASVDDAQSKTAIFRPESADAWKAQLREAALTDAKSRPSADSDNELSSIVLNESEDDETAREAKNMTFKKGDMKGEATAVGEYRLWKSRKVLRSHLDSVRTLAFDRADFTLVSGGDDLTIKVWRLNPNTLIQNSSRTNALPEAEPQITLRGHSGAITSLAVSSTQSHVYSASLDQTVQVWSLPPRDRDTYAPYDSSLKVAQLEGHTDAIWDLSLLPLRICDEDLLATASADGTVKVWAVEDTSQGHSHALKSSWGYGGSETTLDRPSPAPTAVDVCHSDLRKLAVAYQDSVVKLFDIETGQQVLKLKSNESYDGTTATQINRVITHPTLPIVVTAHEDRYIRLFDLNTGACTHSMQGHLDAVTSIDIDPSGLTLVSGGHDCSVRFWDLLSTRTCVQEIASHRVKGGEGVLDVKYHPSLPFMASSGADAIVKLYSA